MEKGNTMEIREKLDDFVGYLNNSMEKPDEYWYDYTTRGSKYFKIIMNGRNHQSVYCFVDKRNGDIYKSAGWSAPAKGIRGSILVTDTYSNADWSGGWLYKIFGNCYNGSGNTIG